MAGIDLTAGPDISDAAKKLEELREAAKMAATSVAGDINATKAVFDALQTRVNAAKDAVKRAQSEIGANKEWIQQLKAQAAEVQETLSTAPANATKKAVQKEIDKINSALNEELGLLEFNKQRLQEYNQELAQNQKVLKMAQTEFKAYQSAQKDAETTYVAIPAQMTNIRNEMAQLDMAGQKNSARYKELQNELGLLGTAYRKVQFEQNALSTGAAQWAGIQSALQGVIGGFSAYQGILGLASINSEKLVKIQTRLQSAMSIVSGMMQVSNTLHATSAARMTTLSKVTELWTAANKQVATGLIRVGIGANTARIAAIALNGALTMGVGTAITLLIGWISQQVDKYHEAKNAAEESAKKQREAFESYASSVGSNASGTITKFEALKQKYNDLGDSLSAKKKFIKENTDVFKELGVKLNNVNDADNLFINNSEAFVASVDARARATATMEVAAEKYKEAFKKMLEAENVRDTQKELEESGYTKIVQSGGLNVLDDKQRDELNKKIKRDKKVKRLYAALPHISDPGVRKIVSDKLSERKKEIVKEFLNSVIEDLEEQAKVAEKEGSQASVTGYKFNEAARSRLRDAGITTTADDEAAKKAQQAAEKRTQAQADAQKKLAEIIASGELALWQSQIDSMNEGQEKELEQLDLNTQKKIDAILQEREKELEAYNNAQGLSGEKTATALSDDREKEYAERIKNTSDTAAAQRIEIEDKYTNKVNSKKEQEEKDWNEYLLKYGTFREKFQATKDKYDKLISEAKTEGEKKSFETERDTELATWEVTMSEWAQGLAAKTLEELERLTREARKQLEEAQNAFDSLGSSDTPEAKAYLQTINSLNAKIALLESQTKDAKEAVTDNNWTKGAQLLNEISSTAREAAGALEEFDEGLGQVVTFIATLASAAKNLITTIQGVTLASSAAGAAMTSMEKASVILAAISVAFQIMQAVFSLLNREDPVAKTRQAFAELNDEIIRLKREAAINSFEGTIFGDNAYDNAISNMKVATEALDRYNQGLENIRQRGEEVIGDSRFADESQQTGMGNLYRMPKSWDSAAESIANMQVQTRHSTWFRSAKYDSLGNLLPQLFTDGQLDMEALKEFQGSDLYNKISEQNRDLIDGLIDNWELYEEALEAVRDYLSDLFGDLGGTMTDALVDAFANGTDAAKAFSDSISDMLKKLAKQMILSTFLTPIFEKAQKQLEGVMAENLTDEARFAKFADIMKDLTNEALAAQDNIFALLDAFEKAAKENGFDIFGDDSAGAQSSSARGFQAMSQETGTELNGRFTTIQSKVTDIRDYALMLTANGTQQLYETINIRDIMIQLRGDVADIRGYTQVLPAMNDTLTSMNRKLDNL